MNLNKEVETRYKEWRAIARSLTRDSVAADDLLHSTLESFLPSPVALRLAEQGGDAVFLYVIRCMRIAWISPRSRYHYTYRKAARLTDELTFDPPAPDAGMATRCLNETCDAMVSRLPELEALLVRMYVMPDFDYDHLSIVTGIEKSYLYARINCAIDKLRKYAETQGITAEGG